jgi:8-oxo-dGTP pyrophosphatase MutT (NUDIX family)
MQTPILINSNTRVRGLLVTSDNQLMLIRRVRPGQEPYWVFPGGGLESSDKTPEDAVAREVAEELGGQIEVGRLVYVITRTVGEGERQDELYFFCRLAQWSGERTGPEFKQLDRGEYILDLVPLANIAINSLNIKPDSAKAFLLQNSAQLDKLPDVRDIEQQPRSAKNSNS